MEYLRIEVCNTTEIALERSAFWRSAGWTVIRLALPVDTVILDKVEDVEHPSHICPPYRKQDQVTLIVYKDQ